MTIRPSTRGELRAQAWEWLRTAEDPQAVKNGLLLLGALDSAEAGDSDAIGDLDRISRHFCIEESPEGPRRVMSPESWGDDGRECARLDQSVSVSP